MAHGFGFGSYPPQTRPPTSSFQYVRRSGSRSVGNPLVTPGIASVTMY